MSNFKEVMVHYLTKGGTYGDEQEAERAIDDMLDEAADLAVKRLREKS